MIWYDVIWHYDMIWYDMMWYDMIWYDMKRYDMIWYDMIWYDMISYNLDLKTAMCLYLQYKSMSCFKRCPSRLEFSQLQQVMSFIQPPVMYILSFMTWLRRFQLCRCSRNPRFEVVDVQNTETKSCLMIHGDFFVNFNHKSLLHLRISPKVRQSILPSVPNFGGFRFRWPANGEAKLVTCD